MGLGYLFDCTEIYESFKRKDLYTRKVVRLLYMRLLPVMFERWMEYHEEYRKKAYAFHHYFQRFMRKCFEALLEIQSLEQSAENQEKTLKRKDSLDEDLSEDMIYYVT